MNYKKINQTCSIPVCKNGISIGFYINIKTHMETLFYGDVVDVRNMILNEKAENVYQLKARKLGSMFNDVTSSLKSDELNEVINELNAVLKDLNGNGKIDAYLNKLEEIYKKTLSHNIVTSYIIIYIYNAFIMLKKQQNENVSISAAKECFSKFASGYNKTIIHLQIESKNIPVYSLEETIFISDDVVKEQDDTELMTLQKRKGDTWDLYYVSAESLYPLILCYYEQLKAANLYISNCTVCNKVMILNRVNNYAVCESEKCRNEKRRNATRKSRANIESGSLRDLYDKFFNKINASRCANLNEMSRIEFDNRFRIFCAEAKAKKKELELESNIESDNGAYQSYSAYLNSAEKKYKNLIKKLKSGEEKD